MNLKMIKGIYDKSKSAIHGRVWDNRHALPAASVGMAYPIKIKTQNRFTHHSPRHFARAIAPTTAIVIRQSATAPCAPATVMPKQAAAKVSFLQV